MSSQQAAPGQDSQQHEHGHHDHPPLVELQGVEVEETQSWQRVVSIKLPVSEWDQARATVLVGIRRKAQLPGFRKGKVPKAMVESHYAREIAYDALDWLLPRAWHQAMHEVTLNTVNDPEYSDIDFGEESGTFGFKATVEVRPEVTITGAKGMAVTWYREDPPADGVERTLESLQESRASYAEVERAAADGDRLSVDFRQVDEDGHAILGTEVTGHLFELGSDYVLDAFSDGVRGMSVGEERRFPVTYPADYDQESLAGQSRHFQVTLKRIEEKRLPTLDDAFAAEVGKFKSMDELREQIKGNIEADIENRNRGRLETALVQGLLALNPFELPPSMVENYLVHLVADQERRAGREITDEERREAAKAMRPGAEFAIKRWFVIDTVAKQESLAVDDAEFEAHLESLAKAEGSEVEDIRRSVKRADAEERIREDLLHRKVFAFLEEQATIKREPMPQAGAES